MNFAPAHSPFEESAPEFADVREAAALAAAGHAWTAPPPKPCTTKPACTPWPP